jgi:hypothetical protein
VNTCGWDELNALDSGRKPSNVQHGSLKFVIPSGSEDSEALHIALRTEDANILAKVREFFENPVFLSGLTRDTEANFFEDARVGSVEETSGGSSKSP